MTPPAKDGRAYLHYYTVLYIYDVDPPNLCLSWASLRPFCRTKLSIWSWTEGTPAWDIAMVDNYAYVAVDDWGLRIVKAW